LTAAIVRPGGAGSRRGTRRAAPAAACAYALGRLAPACESRDRRGDGGSLDPGVRDRPWRGGGL